MKPSTQMHRLSRAEKDSWLLHKYWPGKIKEYSYVSLRGTCKYWCPWFQKQSLLLVRSQHRITAVEFRVFLLSRGKCERLPNGWLQATAQLRHLTQENGASVYKNWPTPIFECSLLYFVHSKVSQTNNQTWTTSNVPYCCPFLVHSYSLKTLSLRKWWEKINLKVYFEGQKGSRTGIYELKAWKFCSRSPCSHNFHQEYWPSPFSNVNLHQIS